MESAGEDETRGGKPDFDDSPDVLIWSRTFKGVVRVEGRALFRAVAVLVDVRVWIVWRFGMARASCR